MKKYVALFISTAIMFFSFTIPFAEPIHGENYGYIPYKRETAEISTENSVPIMKVGEELPQKYDSREYGYVSPVKNQGSTNTCWAYAAIGVLESYMLKNYGEKDENGKVINTAEFDFSENHMQYMMSEQNNNPLGFKTGTGVNSGGNAFMSGTYFLNDCGPVDDKDDPLKNYNKRDYTATKDIKKSKYKVEDVSYVDQYTVVGIDNKKSELIAETKYLVKNYGAATCGIYSGRIYFSADYENLYCGKAMTANHQVMIVGWDDTYAKENFKCTGNNNELPEYDGAFIAKNSWGSSTHGDGFFYISYCDYNLLFDVMAVTGASLRKGNELLYNSDPYFPISSSGWSYTDGNLYCPINCYGNIFTRKVKNEALCGVRFYGYFGYTYKIYLIDSEVEINDQNNTLNFTDYRNKRYLGTYTPQNSGYYTVDTQNIQLKSDKFAIMLAVDTAEPVYMPYEDNCAGFITKAKYTAGESFCGSLQNDGLFFSYFLKADNSHAYNNYSVKAITVTNEPYAEFELANFTDITGAEKTKFSAGDTVYIVPALNGINLTDKEIICIGYKDNALETAMYKKVGDSNKFEINNIPSDFYDLKFDMYIWELGKLKPICEGVSVGVK